MQDLQISLTVTGSPTTIAAVIAAVAALNKGNDLSTSTGTGTPVAPTSPLSPSNTDVPIPTVPSPPMMPPMTTGADGGEASDGTGLDSAGLLWDDRIHSTPAKKNKDGTWRARRGVEKEYVTQIEAELRAGADAQTPPQPIPAAPIPMQPEAAAAPVMPPMPTVPMPAPEAAAPPAMPVPMPAPAPAPVVEQPPMPVAVPQPIPVPALAPQPVPEAAAPPPPAAVNGSMTFEQFMDHVMGNMGKINPADGKPLIHADYLEQIVIESSIAWNRPLQAITDLRANPDMIDWVIQAMQRDGRW